MIIIRDKHASFPGASIPPQRLWHKLPLLSFPSFVPLPNTPFLFPLPSLFPLPQSGPLKSTKGLGERILVEFRAQVTHLVAATYKTIISNQSWEKHQFGGRVQHLEKL